jgi:hypothetical protein
MKINGRISQFEACYGKSFMNVVESHFDIVGVWGCYDEDTYLFRNKGEWWLIQFEDKRQLRDYLNERPELKLIGSIKDLTEKTQSTLKEQPK